MPGLAPRRVAAEGGHGAVLSWPECVDRVAVSYGAAFQVEGVKTDAKLVVVRNAAHGPVVGFLMVGGTFLEVDGVPLVKAEGGLCSVSAEVASGQVALGMADKGKVTVTGFEVKQATRYNGVKGGESLRFQRTEGLAPGVEIHL